MILTTRELLLPLFFFFFCSDPAPTEIYTLSLHDALPIMRAYFAASPRMNSAKAPGELSAISRPCASKPFFTSGRASAVLTSAETLAMISDGVPAGARRPYQLVSTTSGRPDSRAVGTLGSCGERCSEVTASARSRPAWTNRSTDATEAKVTWTWPDTASAVAGPEPL